MVSLGPSAFDIDKVASDPKGKSKKLWRCNHCHEPPGAGKKLKACGACRARHYCGPECAKADWSGHAGHRVECLATTEMRKIVDAEGPAAAYSEEALSKVREVIMVKCEKALHAARNAERFREKVVAEAAAATEAGVATGAAATSAAAAERVVDSKMALYALRHSPAWETAWEAYVPPPGGIPGDPSQPLSSQALAELCSKEARDAGLPSPAEAQAAHAEAAKSWRAGGAKPINPKDFVRFRWQRRLEGCPLHDCVGAAGENLEALGLFLDAGEDVDSTEDPLDKGSTPLFDAAKVGALGAMEVLLERGARVDHRRPPLRPSSFGGGCPPIWQAVYQSPPEAVELLAMVCSVREGM